MTTKTITTGIRKPSPKTTMSCRVSLRKSLMSNKLVTELGVNANSTEMPWGRM